jgi:hypothetical protein
MSFQAVMTRAGKQAPLGHRENYSRVFLYPDFCQQKAESLGHGFIPRRRFARSSFLLTAVVKIAHQSLQWKRKGPTWERGRQKITDGSNFGRYPEQY